MPICGGTKTQALGYQEVAVAGSVVSITDIPQGTDAVFLKFALGPMRVCLDGSTPAGGSFGLEVYDGDGWTLSAHEASLAKFIRDGSVNGIVKALFLSWI
jgi:hypothetical protein